VRGQPGGSPRAAGEIEGCGLIIAAAEKELPIAEAHFRDDTNVTRAAERVGLHNSASDKLEDHFSHHCCRHWYCTHLFRAGMRREFIKELRSYSQKDAFDLDNQ